MPRNRSTSKHTYQVEGKTFTKLMDNDCEYGVNANGEHRIWSPHLEALSGWYKYTPKTRQVHGHGSFAASTAGREALEAARKELGQKDKRIEALEKDGTDYRERIAQLVDERQRLERWLNVHVKRSVNSILNDVDADGNVPAEVAGEATAAEMMSDDDELYELALQALKVVTDAVPKGRGAEPQIRRLFPSYQSLVMATADEFSAVSGIGKGTANKMVLAIDELVDAQAVEDSAGGNDFVGDLTDDEVAEMIAEATVTDED
jgi:hypothetical protein